MTENEKKLTTEQKLIYIDRRLRRMQEDISVVMDILNNMCGEHEIPTNERIFFSFLQMAPMCMKDINTMMQKTKYLRFGDSHKNEVYEPNYDNAVFNGETEGC